MNHYRGVEDLDLIFHIPPYRTFEDLMDSIALVLKIWNELMFYIFVITGVEEKGPLVKILYFPSTPYYLLFQVKIQIIVQALTLFLITIYLDSETKTSNWFMLQVARLTERNKPLVFRCLGIWRDLSG